LKEIELRYNNLENLFDKIVEKLAVFDGWSYMNLFGKTKKNLKSSAQKVSKTHQRWQIRAVTAVVLEKQKAENSL